jgi:hypothetical protein
MKTQNHSALYAFKPAQTARTSFEEHCSNIAELREIICVNLHFIGAIRENLPRRGTLL